MGLQGECNNQNFVQPQRICSEWSLDTILLKVLLMRRADGFEIFDDGNILAGLSAPGISGSNMFMHASFKCPESYNVTMVKHVSLLVKYKRQYILRRTIFFKG